MTRTVQTTPVQSKFNGKWGCTFRMIASHAGVEYTAGELETAALWFDPVAAQVAGRRALEVLETTGKWPNLCEVW